MASFTDKANDVVLFLGWWDYLAITKRLPVEAQVFQAWWYGGNDKAMYPGEIREKVRMLFPNIMADDHERRTYRTWQPDAVRLVTTDSFL